MQPSSVQIWLLKMLSTRRLFKTYSVKSEVNIPHLEEEEKAKEGFQVRTALVHSRTTAESISDTREGK